MHEHVEEVQQITMVVRQDVEVREISVFHIVKIQFLDFVIQNIVIILVIQER